MFFGKSNQNDTISSALIVGEIRDLRAAMSKRDERVYDKIDNVEKSVTTLSEAVLKQKGDVDSVKSEVGRLSESVEGINKKVSKLGGEVEGLMTAKKIDGARWTGPQNLIKIIILISVGLGAIIAIAKYIVPVIQAL